MFIEKLDVVVEEHICRLPETREIMAKLNEIIDVINESERVEE